MDSNNKTKISREKSYKMIEERLNSNEEITILEDFSLKNYNEITYIRFHPDRYGNYKLTARLFLDYKDTYDKKPWKEIIGPLAPQNNNITYQFTEFPVTDTYINDSGTPDIINLIYKSLQQDETKEINITVYQLGRERRFPSDKIKITSEQLPINKENIARTIEDMDNIVHQILDNKNPENIEIPINIAI